MIIIIINMHMTYTHIYNKININIKYSTLVFD